MRQIRTLTIAVAFLSATTALAQSRSSQDSRMQPARTQATSQNQKTGTGGELPSVEEQLRVLTEKLNLTGDQQAKVKPILKQLHDATKKLLQDERMSQEERLDKVRPLRKNADLRIRSILDDEQKKKLDQYEQGPHGEMHGGLSGTTPTPQTPQKPPTH